MKCCGWNTEGMETERWLENRAHGNRVPKAGFTTNQKRVRHGEVNTRRTTTTLTLSNSGILQGASGGAVCLLLQATSGILKDTIPPQQSHKVPPTKPKGPPVPRCLGAEVIIELPVAVYELVTHQGADGCDF